MIKFGDQLGDQSPTMAHLSAGTSHFSHTDGGCTLRLTNPCTIKGNTIKRKRSVVRNGGDNQHEGLANPHPQSIVNGTIGDLEGARPTVIRPPVIIPNDLFKPQSNNPVNPFSWSAYSPVKIGRALLAGHTIEGRRAAVRPKPAIGAAPAWRS